MSIVLLYKSTNVSNRETAYQDIGPAFSLKSNAAAPSILPNATATSAQF